MSDLDKLMQNLEKNKVKDKETPQETEELNDADDDDHEDEEIFEDEEDDQEEKVKEKPNVEKPKEEVKDDNINPLEHEVALLQNEGIFRRELLLALKELVEVQKVNAQVMVDIKKTVTGEKNAK